MKLLFALSLPAPAVFVGIAVGGNPRPPLPVVRTDNPRVHSEGTVGNDELPRGESDRAERRGLGDWTDLRDRPVASINDDGFAVNHAMEILRSSVLNLLESSFHADDSSKFSLVRSASRVVGEELAGRASALARHGVR